MPNSSAIPNGITRQHVLDAIVQFDHLDELPDGFGPSTGYDLVHDDHLYPPKIIVGIAAKLATGIALTGGDFSGGEDSKCFRVLRDCGFDVLPKDADTKSMKKVGSTDRTWSPQEYAASIATYMHMLTLELAGADYVKKQLRTELLEQLQNRTHGSAELRFQNISAALARLRLPWVKGYKPREHFSKALLDGLDGFFRQSPDVLEQLQNALDKSSPAELREYAPPTSKPPKPSGTRKRTARKPDYVEMEEKARTLGMQGERLVFNHERKRIEELAPQHINRVRWVSKEDGDGLGYDVASCRTDGSPLYLEVKTTNGNASTPFFVSANEVAFSDEEPEGFEIVRVYEFATDPKLYRLKGSLTVLADAGALSLEPTQFRVR